MKDKIVKEWTIKAEEDFSTAELLFSKKKNPSIIGFHCQQTIEKYFKAYLLKNNKEIVKTHDLVELFENIKLLNNNIIVYKKYLHEINPFSVHFRYPGEAISFKDIKDVFAYTKEIRSYLIKLF